MNTYTQLYRRPPPGIKGNILPLITLALSLTASFMQPAWATKPAGEELEAVKVWAAAHFGPEVSAVPFSFVYDSKPSAEKLSQWRVTQSTTLLDGNRDQVTISYADPKTGLVIRCEAVVYDEFPTVEWTLYFKNTGQAATPIIEKILSLNTSLQRPESAEFTLHYHKGNGYGPASYQPMEAALAPGSTQHFEPLKGRPTENGWPYFNLEWAGGGMIVAIGWTGQWAADFVRDSARGLRVSAGQAQVHFKLLPGEEVRTPRIVLQFWRGGDWIRAQNLWRRWMIAHNMPRPGGKPVVPILEGSSAWQFGEMAGANEENQKLFIDRYLEEGIKLDYWWMDAGWFEYKHSVIGTGTWAVDKKRFPNGLRAITDHAHARSIKCIAWFMPEQVSHGSWLYQNHPEWLIGPEVEPGVVVDSSNVEANAKLLDLGNPGAWTWAVNHFDRMISEEGIDLYRTDLGLQQKLRILDYWRLKEAEDRQGITEIRHVTGLLAFYDELIRRHPGLLIDTCAAGGNRNEIDVLSRAVPLWRSDYWNDGAGAQSMTYGLAFWLPFYGSAAPPVPHPYGFRGNMMPSTVLTVDVRRKDLDYDMLRRLVRQWRMVSPNYLGDYYPLTPHRLSEDGWIAWQFDRPEAGEGVVHAFRRSASVDESARYRLRGLHAKALYRVTNLDEEDSAEMSGNNLMDKGLFVRIPGKPGAAVVTYRKAP